MRAKVCMREVLPPMGGKFLRRGFAVKAERSEPKGSLYSKPDEHKMPPSRGAVPYRWS